jgi:SAM-dependent methyltransferase
MIKYVTMAGLFKLLSTSIQTRKLYRHMANLIGSNRRASRGLPSYNVERGQAMVELLQKHDAIRNGDRLLELGTGWVHWESIFIRLFYNVTITLFDISDNRQLKPLKRYFTELDKVLDTEITMVPEQREKAHGLLKAITEIGSFDDLYHLLDFRYVIEPSGTLGGFPDESFRLIYSCDVLEHVNQDKVGEYINSIYRLLEPGGYTVHTIDMGDHIAYFDPSVSVKNYMKYSDKIWKRYFESEIQYFNRIQRSEWLGLFEAAGLKLISEKPRHRDININVHQKYGKLAREDRDCISLVVMHQKVAA